MDKQKTIQKAADRLAYLKSLPAGDVKQVRVDKSDGSVRRMIARLGEQKR